MAERQSETRSARYSGLLRPIESGFGRNGLCRWRSAGAGRQNSPEAPPICKGATATRALQSHDQEGTPPRNASRGMAADARSGRTSAERLAIAIQSVWDARATRALL